VGVRLEACPSNKPIGCPKQDISRAMGEMAQEMSRIGPSGC
jgi:hypothetical protein